VRISRISTTLAASALILSMSSGMWPPAFAADQQITLDPPVLRLAAGQSSGVDTLQVKVEGVQASDKPDCEAQLKADDNGTPDPPHVAVAFSKADISRSDHGRVCLLTATVSNLPYNSSQLRFIRIGWGSGPIGRLQYTLTNKPDGPSTLAVKQPPAMELRDGESIAISLIAGAKSADEVRLGYVSMYEQSRKTSLSSEGYQLCAEPSGTCTPPINVAAGKGSPAGSATVVTIEKPEGETFQLEVYRRVPYAWIWGGLAILLGVLLAWLISTWGRSRFNRDQLLLPAVALRARIETLTALLGQAPPGVLQPSSNCYLELTALSAKLTDQTLSERGFIPAIYAAAFPLQTRALEDYRRFLDDIDQRIIVLSWTITSGFVVAWDQLTSPPAPATVTVVAAAITAMDQAILATPAGPATLPSITQAISTALATLHVALAAPAGAGLRAGARPLLGAPPTAAVQYDRLLLEMRAVSASVWAATFVITTVAGVYVLVLQNLGFGSTVDYFGCVLWGIGLPVGLQQMSSLTANSAVTSLGISVSKS
jgi:hypothetical protein